MHYCARTGTQRRSRFGTPLLHNLHSVLLVQPEAALLITEEVMSPSYVQVPLLAVGATSLKRENWWFMGQL